MDEKRLVKLLWVVKAGLLAVLAYAGFEVVVSRLHLGVVLDPRTVSGEPRATRRRLCVPRTPLGRPGQAGPSSPLLTRSRFDPGPARLDQVPPLLGGISQRRLGEEVQRLAETLAEAVQHPFQMFCGILHRRQAD